MDADADSLTVPNRSSDEEKGSTVIGTAVQQSQHKIEQKTQDTDKTNTQNVRQQQQQEMILQQHGLERQQKQDDKYISMALQEQKERLQAHQK